MHPDNKTVKVKTQTIQRVDLKAGALIDLNMSVSYHFFKTRNPGRCSLRKFRTSE